MAKTTLSNNLLFKYFIILLMSLSTLSAAAQFDGDDWGEVEETAEEVVDEVPECLTLETLQLLIRMDFNSAFDTLFELGYTLNADRSVIRETVDYVELTFQRFTYENSGQQVILMQSNEGLGNYVIYRSDTKNCSLKEELRKKNYVHGDKSTVYVGSENINGRMDHFEADLRESNGMWLSYRNIDERNRYVETKTREMRNTIRDAIVEAQMLATQGQFRQALLKVDSMMDFYPPMNDTLTICNELIKKQQWDHYEGLMHQYVGETRYGEALQISDTLLELNPEHQATLRTRQLLAAQLGHKSIAYRERCPEEFNNIYNELSRIVNLDIREHRYTDRQELSLAVKIRTNRVNESHGTLRLSYDGNNRKQRTEVITRQNKMQAMVDNVVNSSIIKPQVEENIYVITEDSLSLQVNWRYTTMKINGDERRDSTLMYRLVDSIEDMYFSYMKPSQTQINYDGSPKMIKAWKLPTKRVYTFGLTQKECNGNNYADISLIDFATTHTGSWIPSIIVPGLATYQQNARDNVVGRALPFFVFGAIGAAGLVWEKVSADRGIARPGLNDVETAHIWEYKNSGYIAAAGGLTIAGSIYIVELVQAIRNSISNTLRTRELRRDLRNGSILLQEQDVPLQ